MAKSDKELDLSEAGRYDSAAGWDPDAELEAKNGRVRRMEQPYSDTFDIKNAANFAARH